jgi:hypothetical protein
MVALAVAIKNICSTGCFINVEHTTKEKRKRKAEEAKDLTMMVTMKMKKKCTLIKDSDKGDVTLR